MIDTTVMDKLVKSVTSLGSVEVMEDAKIPGCPHMADRYIMHLKQLDQGMWESHRASLLTALATQSPPLQVHICTMHTYDMVAKCFRDFYNIELAATGVDVDRFITLIRDIKGKPLSIRSPKQVVKVDTVENISSRSKLISSAPLSRSMIDGSQKQG